MTCYAREHNAVLNKRETTNNLRLKFTNTTTTVIYTR